MVEFHMRRQQGKIVIHNFNEEYITEMFICANETVHSHQ